MLIRFSFFPITNRNLPPVGRFNPWKECRLPCPMPAQKIVQTRPAHGQTPVPLRGAAGASRRSTMPKVRMLAIGHSYVLACNRALPRYLAEHYKFDVTVAAPDFFHGDLRPIDLEPEPPGSPLRLVGLPALCTAWVHW